jgi:hypothetical protein
LIEIGIIQSTITVGGKAIVSVLLTAGEECPLRIGQDVIFSVSGRHLLTGFKYWPEKGIVDLLFNQLPAKPAAGEDVFIE